ncbi:MAG: hypothetical protein ACI90V_004404, partial [Bacillariaceae sp.]
NCYRYTVVVTCDELAIRWLWAHLLFYLALALVISVSNLEQLSQRTNKNKW